MSFITLDFETYYSAGYSLSKLTTEEYIRDPQFEIIGVSIKVDDAPATWITGSHEHIRSALGGLDWATSAVLCHNALFDGAILEWVLGCSPAYYYDTLCMGRAEHGVSVGGSLAALSVFYGVGEKGTEVISAKEKRRADFSDDELRRYGDYCINDVELTYKICSLMLGRDKFPESECNLIDMTIKMFTRPQFHLDDALLVERLEQVKQTKQELLSSLKDTLKVDTEEEVRAKLASNPQFAQILAAWGVEPPTKISPATGKTTFAFAKTDEGFLALQEHPDPVIQQLCAVRLGTKSTLEESRIARFIGIGQRNKGMLPIPLKYYGAHTGRWSGCLVDASVVTVYNSVNGVEEKQIVDVLLDDLVWDGAAFVAHEGVAFSGFAEVIEWDGVRGTENHVVYTDSGAISLRDAMQRGERIQTAARPTKDAVDAARRFTGNYETED